MKLSYEQNLKFYKTPTFINAEKKTPKKITNFFNKEVSLVINQLKSCKNKLILDIGCGDGRLIDALLQEGVLKYNKVIGIDINSSCLKEARNKYFDKENISIVSSDAINMIFKESLFDVIICTMNTLGNFIEKKENVVKEIYRVSKKNAVCLISVYSKNALEYQKKWYSMVGFKCVKVTPNYYVSEDKINNCFISERFDIKELKQLFDKRKFEMNIIPSTNISHFLKFKIIK